MIVKSMTHQLNGGLKKVSQVMVNNMLMHMSHAKAIPLLKRLATIIKIKKMNKMNKMKKKTIV